VSRLVAPIQSHLNRTLLLSTPCQLSASELAASCLTLECPLTQEIHIADAPHANDLWIVCIRCEYAELAVRCLWLFVDRGTRDAQIAERIRFYTGKSLTARMTLFMTTRPCWWLRSVWFPVFLVLCTVSTEPVREPRLCIMVVVSLSPDICWSSTVRPSRAESYILNVPWIVACGQFSQSTNTWAHAEPNKLEENWTTFYRDPTDACVTVSKTSDQCAREYLPKYTINLVMTSTSYLTLGLSSRENISCSSFTSCLRS
jgi:hypothetical protein